MKCTVKQAKKELKDDQADEKAAEKAAALEEQAQEADALHLKEAATTRGRLLENAKAAAIGTKHVIGEMFDRKDDLEMQVRTGLEHVGDATAEEIEFLDECEFSVDERDQTGPGGRG